MPQLSLPDAVRYFISPFLLLGYLMIYDYDFVSKTQATFSYLGAVVALVSGILIYFIYRYVVYQRLMWMHDIFGTRNYRNFIRANYVLPVKNRSFAATVLSEKIAFHVFKNLERSERMHLLSSAIHLFYQASFIAVGFLIASAWQRDLRHFLIFFGVSIIFGSIAFKMNNDAEDQELILLESVPSELEASARLFNVRKREDPISPN
jgi:hypothetical protein